MEEYERSMEFIKMDLSSSLSTILGLFLPCAQTPCKRLLRRVPGTADYKMEENERRLCHRIDRALAYEHLIAGTKTTAFTVSSLVYLVSCHPRVEEKLLAEVDAFVDVGAGRAPDADDLQSRFP
jgi:hypothetical protein